LFGKKCQENLGGIIFIKCDHPACVSTDGGHSEHNYNGGRG